MTFQHALPFDLCKKLFFIGYALSFLAIIVLLASRTCGCSFSKKTPIRQGEYRDALSRCIIRATTHYRTKKSAEPGGYLVPAIISHHLFSQDVYQKSPRQIGGTQKEHEAFLLGNQSSDPLFYLVALPHLSSYFTLGSLMHQQKPPELLFAFKQSLSILDEKEYAQGRAYLLGFLCHYLIDQEDFARSDALSITRNCNFSGELIVPPHGRKTPHA